MRIDILTFHCVNNYGAVLQAYALKRRLTCLGHDAQVVNFAPGYKTWRYALFPWYPSRKRRFVHSLLSAGKIMCTNLRNGRAFFARKRAMKRFRRRHLTGSSPALRFEWQLRKPRGEALIVGSDQIWNFSLTGDRPRRPYFGAVAHYRRVISYAASMGADRINTSLFPEFKSMLARVDAISVREREAIPFFESLGREATAVVDPTLLLSAEEWRDIEAAPPSGQSPYILLYPIAMPKELYDFAEELSRRTGLPVIELRSVTARPSRPGFFRNSFSGPDEFLTLFRNARYVLTTSFHGTAFSAIYHKDFLAFDVSGDNLRIRNLLDELGLSARLATQSEIPDIDASVDWDAVDVRRSAMAKRSEDFLTRELRLCEEAPARAAKPVKSPTLFKSKRDCCGCGACADACAQRAIQLWPDREGFLYPKIDPAKCVGCGRCATVCPIKNASAAPMPERCIAAKFPGRESSASGGAFFALARAILKRGGVAFGAGWTQDMGVAHRPAESPEELEALRGSKYVQSDCQGAYRAAMDALRADRWVLFSGMPCQTEAMCRLANGHPKLVTASLVCQGAPSPVLWANYVERLESRHKGKLTAYNFRDKRLPNNGKTASWRIGEREFSAPHSKEPYCKLFGARRILRPSCHACPFSTPARMTDITIGDAWGLSKVDPEFDDGMGTSLVIPHTPQGQALWDEVCREATAREYPMEALRQNRLCSPSPAGPSRFFALRAWRWMPMSKYLKLAKLFDAPDAVKRRLKRAAQRLSSGK